MIIFWKSIYLFFLGFFCSPTLCVSSREDTVAAITQCPLISHCGAASSSLLDKEKYLEGEQCTWYCTKGSVSPLQDPSSRHLKCWTLFVRKLEQNTNSLIFGAWCKCWGKGRKSTNICLCASHRALPFRARKQREKCEISPQIWGSLLLLLLRIKSGLDW